MLLRRPSSPLIFYIKLLFEFPRGLVGFRDVEVIDVDVLDIKRPVRCLKFLRADTVFELKFRVKSMACCRVMQVHLTHYIVR